MTSGGPGRDLSQGSSSPRARGEGRLGVALRVLVLLPLLFLAACAVVDPLTRDTCISVLPAVEQPGARLTLVAAEPDPARPGNVRLTYTVATGGHPPYLRHLVCAFGIDGASGDRRALLGVRTGAGEMNEARFFILKRFWLADPVAVAEGLSRVTIDPGSVSRGLVTLPPTVALRLQQLIDAGAPAALYALLAIACALIWGLVGRINFAFGDIAMLGAWGALIGALLIEGLGIAAVGPLVGVALVAAAVIGAAWGGVLGRVVYAPLAFRAAQPLLIATVGLSIALQEFVARSPGARDRFLKPLMNEPRLVADGPFTVLVTPMHLLVVGLSLAVAVAVLAIFPKTRFGRDWRAVADDATMARLLGIDPSRVLVGTFALASALAGIAGAILTLAWGGTSFHMGTMLGLKAVVAAVVGGIGSLPGAALGGLLVGLVEAAWTAAFGSEWRDTAVLSLLVVVLVFRPAGLLGGTEAPAPRLSHD